MQSAIKEGENLTTIELVGRLDYASAVDMEGLFKAVLSVPRRRLLLDFSGIDFIGSIGIRVLMGGLRAARQADCDMALCGLRGDVRRILILSGIATLLPVFFDAPAAASGGWRTG